MFKATAASSTAAYHLLPPSTLRLCHPCSGWWTAPRRRPASPGSLSGCRWRATWCGAASSTSGRSERRGGGRAGERGGGAALQLLAAELDWLRWLPRTGSSPCLNSSFARFPPLRLTQIERSIEASFLSEAEMVFTTLSSTQREVFQKSAARAPFHTGEVGAAPYRLQCCRKIVSWSFVSLHVAECVCVV